MCIRDRNSPSSCTGTPMAEWCTSGWHARRSTPIEVAGFGCVAERSATARPFLLARIVREGEAAMSMTELWPGAPRVVGPADLGAAAAFSALVTQGYLHEIWNDRAVASDVPVTPAIRADALFGSLSPAARRCVVGRVSAVWIHTGAHRPRRADLLVPAGVRIPAPDVGHVAPVSYTHLTLPTIL